MKVDLSSWNSVWAMIKLRPELLALLALPCGAGFRIHQHYFCLIFSSVFSFDKLTMFWLNLSWSVSHWQAATWVFWTLLLICFLDIFYCFVLLFCFFLYLLLFLFTGADLSGYVYADNYFELFYNGQFIAVTLLVV